MFLTGEFMFTVCNQTFFWNEEKRCDYSCGIFMICLKEKSFFRVDCLTPFPVRSFYLGTIRTQSLATLVRFLLARVK